MSACYALAMIPSITHLSFLSFLLIAILDGVQSDISLIHPDDINWFLTCDETHHVFSNEGHKGGSTAQRYTSSSFHRSVEWCVASNSHTTGVYGTTGSGYLMLAIVKVLMPKAAPTLIWPLYNVENLLKVAW